MNTDEKKIIVDYLSGPRERLEGVAIYNRFGQNLRLKRQFLVDESAVTLEMLFEELRKLAGLSELEFRNLPRRAASVAPVAVHEMKPVKKTEKSDDSVLEDLADSFGVSVSELLSNDFQERVLTMDENAERVEELEDELAEARKRYSEAPEPVKKMIRFRDRYPFLKSEDCPDVLKVLVSDMFTAYDDYKSAHARLRVMNDDASAAVAADCEKVVESYLKNREIWDELEYYKEHGEILGKASKFREMKAADELASLSEIDLMKQLNSASVNVSKHQRAVNKAKESGTDDEKAMAALNKWTLRKQALRDEVERRKKK